MPTIKGPITIKAGEEIPEKVKDAVMGSLSIKKKGSGKNASKSKKN